MTKSTKQAVTAIVIGLWIAVFIIIALTGGPAAALWLVLFPTVLLFAVVGALRMGRNGRRVPLPWEAKR